MDGQLSLDSTPMPDDQYDPIEKANNAIIWRPGPGKLFTQTAPGNHTATDPHYLADERGPRARKANACSRTFSWTFKVG